MIIDFHTHTFPEKIASSAIAKMQSDSHSASFTSGTQKALIDSMRKSGIDYSVVLPVITNPVKDSHINSISTEQNGKDGLIYFGGIHPDSENIREKLKYLASNGIKGIKIHPVYQGADIDDIRFLNILSLAGELGLTVITHSGDDIGFPGVVRCSPKMLINAVKQVGNVRLVAAHMGGWKNWDEVYALAEMPSVFIDTAFSLGKITPIDNHYSAEELKLLDNENFLKIIRIFGSKRVLFGTDSPWDCQKTAKELILKLPLSNEEKDDIFYNNARTILGI